MNFSETQRITIRIGSLLVLLTVPISVVMGIFALIEPSTDDPTPVSVGQPVELPDPGLFGVTVALYGVFPADQFTPSVDELGCVMRDEDGGSTSSAAVMSSLGATWLDPIAEPGTGRRLEPLLKVTGFGPGWTLMCDGPAALAAGPLYLNEAEPFGRLVAVAALSWIIAALTVGVIGLVLSSRSSQRP